MNFGKKGVLIVNLGTPDAPTVPAVRRYLKQFLLDWRVIDYPWVPRNLLVRGIIVPFRAYASTKLYKRLWTPAGSPLKVYGEALAEGIKPLLGDDYVVELAMRYQSPSIESAIQRLMQQQVREIIIFPLFPQYASATTGSVHDEVMRVLRKQQVIPDIKMVNSYYNNSEMVDIFADNAKTFDFDSYDHIIFSYHGLPKRQLVKGDPLKSHCQKKENCCQNICIDNQFCYSAQCHATTKALVEKLNLEEGKYTTSFQSRLGRAEWAKPYTIDVIEHQAEAGAKKLLVFSPAFVADCLETTIEISFEYQEEFEEMGGEHIDLVPSLNDDPRWIKAVSKMVLAAG